MPLRNERQAYWDDIDAHIASVAPLDGDAALERACPRAAADREALRSRLAAVEGDMSALRLARRRAERAVPPPAKRGAHLVIAH